MNLLRILSLATLGLLGLSSGSSDAAKCNKPRVRRVWTALSEADRQLYKDAIATAMDSGKYIKFVEAHAEMMSEKEAHRQCMFIYWHRYFITAFENMLRDQHPRFACVTLPYWDWMTDYDKFLSNKCDNTLNCSPALNFMGGKPPGNEQMRNVTINGAIVAGYCDTGYPMNHFCENSQISGSQCVRCVPRGDWTNNSLPAVTSFTSIRSQLFDSKNIGEMSKAIEEGAHDLVHGTLAGVMFVNQSPSEPMFWSHHSMVDLLHSIFHKCKIGEQKMTFAEKASSVDWTSCERRSGGMFNPTDSVMARTGYLGINPINATMDPLVGKYFSAVPQQYAALVDTRDLGSSSYTYEMQGLTNILYSNCGQSTEAPTSAPTTTSGGSIMSAGDATALPTMGSIANKTLPVESQRMYEWVTKTDKLVQQQGGNSIQTTERMTCLFQDECLGGVNEYPEVFMKSFGITSEPRCKEIVTTIHRTVDASKVAEWKTEMTKVFGCPRPKNVTTGSNHTGSGSGAATVVVGK